MTSIDWCLVPSAEDLALNFCVYFCVYVCGGELCPCNIKLAQLKSQLKWTPKCCTKQWGHQRSACTTYPHGVPQSNWITKPSSLGFRVIEKPSCSGIWSKILDCQCRKTMSPCCLPAILTPYDAVSASAQSLWSRLGYIKAAFEFYKQWFWEQGIRLQHPIWNTNGRDQE